MRAFVYWNINAKRFSIRALEGPHKGRVIAHALDVVIDRPDFRVSEAGRQRVLSSGRKNVHAGIVGEVQSIHISEERYKSTLPKSLNQTQADRVRKGGFRVVYDLRKHKTFMRIDHLGNRVPITNANQVYCHANRLNGSPNVYAI